MRKLIPDFICNHFKNTFYHDGKLLFDRTAALIFSCYFTLLFSYPLVRSASSAIFYDVYTSKEYPLATFITVIALSIVISISNSLQKRISVHQLYLGVGILSSAILSISLIFYTSGVKEFAYVFFATKEIYIVLLIQLMMAFANGYFSLVHIKKLYGPLGAIGSIGGIVGGQLTSIIAKGYGTSLVVYISIIVILFASCIFYMTRHSDFMVSEEEVKITPFKAIQNVKKYVFYIALIVALSQFVIFIADLQFNINFEKMIENKDDRTAYLGQIYSLVNAGALFIQFVFLPYVLMRFKTKSIFIFVPVFFLFLVTTGISLGASTLWVTAGVFIAMKSTDYSVFSVAKELLFHPLTHMQKYGAKYITDIFIYRVAKGAMAIGIYYVSIKSITVLNSMQMISISMWILVIFMIFNEQRRLKINEE